jgi:serine racemase
MDDEDMIHGMRLGFERMKLVVEPASGAAIAAACSDKMKGLDRGLSKVGVILCGGNVDLDQLPF